MNKKGYLITIVTVLLLLSLILLASSYATRLKDNEEIYIKSILGDKLNYIEGDIGPEFFVFWNLNETVISTVGNEMHIDLGKLLEVAHNVTYPYENLSENFETFIEGVRIDID